MSVPILTSIVFLPLAGALALMLVGNRDGQRDGAVRWLALAVAIAVFADTLLLWALFNPAQPEFQFVERYDWIPAFGIQYAVGVDGISLFLIVLTGFLTPIALLSSGGSVNKKIKEFSIFLLALETAMLGVFVSLDLFLFYIFWDAMLIPMYFLIGIWGYDRRIYAAVKFMLYTMAGSVLMLVAIIGLAYVHYRTQGAYSFDLLKLYDLPLPPHLEVYFFLAFTLAFAINVPLFPFHTWLPDAHVVAPTAGSVILAGVLLKMGTYGLVRFSMPLFPHAAAAFAPYLAVLAVVGIVYGALVSMVQPDLKKLVAYSSVSHLGFVVLGIATLNVQGIEGAVYQMVNHGVSTGALFLIVGMLSDRRHTRLISQFGGLKSVVPRLTAVFMIITLSSIGLPGLNGFVGEFLILVGAFRWRPTFAAVAALGVILSAVYMLWMFQRVNYGKVTHEENRLLPDLTLRECWVIVPTVVVAVIMGLAPSVFLRPMEPSVNRLLQRVSHGATVVDRRWSIVDGPESLARLRENPLPFVLSRSKDERFRVEPPCFERACPEPRSSFEHLRTNGGEGLSTNGMAGIRGSDRGRLVDSPEAMACPSNR
jgi:NADH-quinone oxidoreductase subunit M